MRKAVQSGSLQAKSRVLLIGGGEPVLSVVRQALVASSWVLRVAGRSEDPVPWMAEAPDVVIVDALEDDRAPIPLLTQLREVDARGGTPLVLLLGADAPEVVTAAYAAGAADVLVAPVRPAALADRVAFQVRSAQVVNAVRSQVQELLHAQRIGGTGSWTLASISGLMQDRKSVV